ncbi:MAG: hypothetical protein IMZ66_11135, partial [Planctomycetes bacterium]|nr:hypothetical protein [Planctomycetota bacterium]
MRCAWMPLLTLALCGLLACAAAGPALAARPPAPPPAAPQPAAKPGPAVGAVKPGPAVTPPQPAPPEEPVFIDPRMLDPELDELKRKTAISIEGQA